MLRWLFHISAGVSLVLCVASAVLWWRSNEGPAMWDVGESVTVSNRDGVLTVMDQWLAYYSPSFVPPPRMAQAWAFEVPWWAVTSLTGLLPAAWMVWLVWRIRRRVGPGHCRQCGYDLRGSAGACPECGAETSLSRV